MEAVFGHDAGSLVAAWCALIRPDVFLSVAMMSAPFSGPPSLPFNTDSDGPRKMRDAIHEELAALKRPRKHYHWYYSTRPANDDMVKCAQGVHAFMRAYYHHKSADWTQNQPFPLKSWTAGELEKMPTYYIMDLDENMAETVAKEMPSAAAIAANKWLPDKELRCTRKSMDATAIRAACSGIGATPPVPIPPIFNCSPAGRSTCRPAS